MFISIISLSIEQEQVQRYSRMKKKITGHESIKRVIYTFSNLQIVKRIDVLHKLQVICNHERIIILKGTCRYIAVLD